MIVRGPHPERGFTIVDNNVVRDDRLSLRARGLLVSILSRPDNWRVEADALAREVKEGRDAVLRALAELREAGYVVQTKEPMGRGRWATQTTVYDRPLGAFPQVAPETGYQDSEDQDSEDQDSENQGSIERTETKNQLPLSSETAVAVPDQERPEVERLCQLLADLIEGNGSKRPTVTKAWRTACRLMLDKDHREPQAIDYLIRWCQNDEFWRGNVLSMPTFRKQYDQLRIKALNEWHRRQKGTTTDRRQLFETWDRNAERLDQALAENGATDVFDLIAHGGAQ